MLTLCMDPTRLYNNTKRKDMTEFKQAGVMAEQKLKP